MELWLTPALFLSLSVGLSLAENDPTVRIGNVDVTGIKWHASDGNEFDAYFGLPYGKAERFKKANLVDYYNMTGTINATTVPPKCIQMNLTTNEVEGIEDCLTCNVFVPSTRFKWRYEVVIWFYGGGFVEGDAGNAETPEYLMNKNIDLILVRCNYRLGPLGFMNQGDDKFMPGNYAVNDVCLMTKWVNEYIRYFHGDPYSVTAMGESSGASMAHLAVEVCYPKYVHRFSPGSGFIYGLVLHKKPVMRSTEMCAELVGCTGTTEEVYDCLKNISAEDLVIAGSSPSINLDPHTGLFAWAPTYGSYPIRNYVFEKGLRAKVPLLAGVCKDEWIIQPIIALCPYAIPALRLALEEYLNVWLGKLDSELTKEVKLKAVPVLKNFYFNFNISTASDDVLCKAFSEMAVDAVIYFPWIYSLCLYKGPKWAYYVQYSTELNKAFAKMVNVTVKNPVPHACVSELWGNFRSYYYPTVTAEASDCDYTVITGIDGSISNFCKNNDPTRLQTAPPFTWQPNSKKFELNVVDEWLIGPASPGLVRHLIKVYKLWKNIFNYLPECQ